MTINMNIKKSISSILLVLLVPGGIIPFVDAHTPGDTAESALGNVLAYITATQSPTGDEETVGVKPKIVQNSYFETITSPKIIRDLQALLNPTVREMTVTVTAYSSTPGQTDSTPFITARNTMVRDGIVAANFLPFGTKIKIPEKFGNKVFVVEDRMNSRYDKRIDVWFENTQTALEFGVKNLKIQILD
ncbi:MAG: hypothetical protein CEN90_460 [Parcubacteria group bacterium Licking1014_17]|nr:MAG: hypothetical protein CEN90_460 [Parcubacteria group bacterium Licking1014_17]